MRRVIGCVAVLTVIALACSAPTAAAQDANATRPAVAEPRWSIEAAAGIQTDYGGTIQSVAFGFAPTRSLTLLISAERSRIDFEFKQYPDGYSALRGGKVEFVSAEVRYAFFSRARVAPYALFGKGRGVSNPTVNEFFPGPARHDIDAVYFGAGARVPVHRRLDAFADMRIIVTVSTSGTSRSEMGIHGPLRAGLAWRF